MKENIIFFLGAGFSYDADMPIMDKFFDYSEKELRAIQQYINLNGDDLRLMAPQVYLSGLFYKAFYEEFPPEKARDIEWLFQRAMNLKEEIHDVELIVNKYPIPTPISKKELITHLKFWIWKIYNRLPILKGSVSHFWRTPNVNLYSEFSELIWNLFNKANISIITSNYDMVFEVALWDFCKGTNLPLRAYYPIEYTKLILKGNTEEFIGDAINGIPVFKIHGSANYYTKQNKKKKIYISTDITNKSVGCSRIIGKPVTIHLDGLFGIRNEYGSDLIPEIIPPLYRKKYQKDIFEGAMSVLQEAKKIVFIGYSLPETDKKMKEHLKNNTNSKAEVFVIDPSENVKRNYLDIYGERVTFLKKKFSDTMEDIKKIVN